MLEPTRKSTLTARLLIYPIRVALWLLLKTCHFRVIGQEHLKSAAKQGSAILMLWHSRLPLIGPSILNAGGNLRYCAFISNSKDGDIAAEYTTSYSIGHTIRVPHDARNQALKTLISRLKLKRDVAIVTPDGPRGPRNEVKQGIILAAKETKSALIPFTWKADRYWELNTWDKMQIPKPFSKVTAAFLPPIKLSEETTIEEAQAILKRALDEGLEF